MPISFSVCFFHRGPQSYLSCLCFLSLSVSATVTLCLFVSAYVLSLTTPMPSLPVFVSISTCLSLLLSPFTSVFLSPLLVPALYLSAIWSMLCVSPPAFLNAVYHNPTFLPTMGSFPLGTVSGGPCRAVGLAPYRLTHCGFLAEHTEKLCEALRASCQTYHLDHLE